MQTAVRYRIPLIIWGAHQGLEQVGMFSHEHEVQMTRRYRQDHDLMGVEAAGLLSGFDTLTEEDIWQYRYPDDRSLEEVGVTGIYLGNYVRWDPKAQHESMMAKHAYHTARFARTFDCYDYVDCFNYMNVHDQLKLYKHGYSKVTRPLHAARYAMGASRALRAWRSCGAHELCPAERIDLFCEWLGVTPGGLQFLMDLHRNPRYWQQTLPGRWEFKGWSTASDSGAACEYEGSAGFTATAELDTPAPLPRCTSWSARDIRS